MSTLPNTPLTSRADALKVGDIISALGCLAVVITVSVVHGLIEVEAHASDERFRLQYRPGEMVPVVRFADAGPLFKGQPVTPATDAEFEGL